MKKGIVMEKRRRYMIVMTRNGIFQKAAPMENSDIGEEVYFKPIASRRWLSFFFYPKKNKQTPVRLFAMVCMLLLIAMPFYFIMGNEKTYAYVNIDINPSVELKIDDSLQVRSITALNDDADKIIQNLTNYKNEDIEKVIAMIMNRSEKDGLINKDKNVLVGVSFAKDESQDLDLINRLKRHLSRDKASWHIAAFQVPRKIRKKAEEKNKTMNETMAIEIIEKDAMKENIINKEEKAIIESFYHNGKKNKQPEKPKKDKEINENQDKQSKKQDPIEKDISIEEEKPIPVKQDRDQPNEQKKKHHEKRHSNDDNNKDVSKKKNKNVKHGNHKHTNKKKENKEQKQHQHKKKHHDNKEQDKHKSHHNKTHKDKDNHKHKHRHNNQHDKKGRSYDHH